MKISQKTIEKLRILINEKTESRSGPKLVNFFNELGFNDTYGQGFPSRWIYTEEKLKLINGTPELDKCIKKLFAPINYIGRINDLDNYINEFNQYLEFDNWKVIRSNNDISFKKTDKISALENTEIKANDEDEFLNREFKEIQIKNIGLDPIIESILIERIEEIKVCLNAKASLSVIFLAGSTLEGIFLGLALKYPKEFSSCLASPKDKEGKVKKFQDWVLSNFIDVSYEMKLIKEDIKKFSHSLRDFRNYIHPYAQMSANFSPDNQTSKISFQVLKATIYQINNSIGILKIKHDV